MWRESRDLIMVWNYQCNVWDLYRKTTIGTITFWYLDRSHQRW